MKLKNLESEFYNLWKNVGLNLEIDSIKDENSNDELRSNAYAVWDYPLPDTYTRLWNSILASGFVASIESGVNRILNTNNSLRYALFIDYARAKYIESKSKSCELMTLETRFAQKSYSFGFPTGSVLREKFNDV